MSRTVLRWKWIRCLIGAVITISLVFAPLEASAQMLAQTNEDIGITEGSTGTADSNSAGTIGENGDSDPDDDNPDEAGEGSAIGDTGEQDAAGEGSAIGDTGDHNADNAGENGDGNPDDTNTSGDAEKELDAADDPLALIQEASDSIEGITLLSVPYLSFGEIEFSSVPKTLQASMVGGVRVNDVPGEGWDLSVRYEDITNKLPGRLFFRQGDVEKDITESNEIIYSHSPRYDDEAETIVTKKWNNGDEGFWLEVLSEDITDYDLSEVISATLIWEITPAIQ